MPKRKKMFSTCFLLPEELAGIRITSMEKSYEVNTSLAPVVPLTCLSFLNSKSFLLRKDA